MYFRSLLEVSKCLAIKKQARKLLIRDYMMPKYAAEQSTCLLVGMIPILKSNKITFLLLPVSFFSLHIGLIISGYFQQERGFCLVAKKYQYQT